MSTTANEYYATGKRKTAVARVHLLPGTGAFTLNGLPGGAITLHFDGFYNAALFQLASDRHGGTLVTSGPVKAIALSITSRSRAL